MMLSSLPARIPIHLPSTLQLTLEDSKNKSRGVAVISKRHFGGTFRADDSASPAEHLLNFFPKWAIQKLRADDQRARGH